MIAIGKELIENIENKDFSKANIRANTLKLLQVRFLIYKFLKLRFHYGATNVIYPFPEAIPRLCLNFSLMKWINSEIIFWWII